MFGDFHVGIGFGSHKWTKYSGAVVIYVRTYQWPESWQKNLHFFHVASVLLGPKSF